MMPGSMPRMVNKRLSQNFPLRPNFNRTAIGGRKRAKRISMIPIVSKCLSFQIESYT